MSSKRKVIPFPTPESPYVIARWKLTRFWAISLHGELIALCVYKKGARAVVKHLDERDELRHTLSGLHLISDLVTDDRSPACRISTASS
jgi:hypothetical protein